MKKNQTIDFLYVYISQCIHALAFSISGGGNADMEKVDDKPMIIQARANTESNHRKWKNQRDDMDIHR